MSYHSLSRPPVHLAHRFDHGFIEAVSGPPLDFDTGYRAALVDIHCNINSRPDIVKNKPLACRQVLFACTASAGGNFFVSGTPASGTSSIEFLFSAF